MVSKHSFSLPKTAGSSEKRKKEKRKHISSKETLLQNKFKLALTATEEG